MANAIQMCEIQPLNTRKLSDIRQLTPAEYKALFEQLTEFIRSRGIRREDAEDLCQDLLVRLSKKAIEANSQKIPLIKYAYISAKYAAISYYRRFSRKPDQYQQFDWDDATVASENVDMEYVTDVISRLSTKEQSYFIEKAFLAVKPGKGSNRAYQAHYRIRVNAQKMILQTGMHIRGLSTKMTAKLK